MRRIRLATVVLAIACAITVATPARAGSYLDRATLLLSGSEKDLSMVRDHLSDKELATMVELVADARLKAASKMEIPAVIAKAHPHLLLVLEHTERPADSAREGNVRNALEHLDDAEREDRMFRELLTELGFPLPSSKQ